MLCCSKTKLVLAHCFKLNSYPVDPLPRVTVMTSIMHKCGCSYPRERELINCIVTFGLGNETHNEETQTKNSL